MPPAPSRRSLFALAGLTLGGAALSHAALAGESAPTPQLTSADMIGKRLRVIHPGQVVTMDYSEERLNIEVDAQNRITRIHVG